MFICVVCKEKFDNIFKDKNCNNTCKYCIEFAEHKGGVMKHTQGKWKYIGLGKVVSPVIDKTLGEPYIHLPIAGMHYTIEEANAKLIASAPELLETLKDLVNGLRVKMGKRAIQLRIELAEEAIASAEEA